MFDAAGTPILVFRAEGDPGPMPSTTPTPAPTSEAANSVQIRILNDSQVDFEQVSATFPRGNRVDDGQVPSGGSSDYRRAGQAYGYAYVKAIVDGRRPLVWQSVDYRGEKLLEPGRYTYVLAVDDGSLTLRLKVDP